MDNFDKYIYEGTNVLKNKFNIRDAVELRNIEEEILENKLVYLYMNPDKIPSTFDKQYLKHLHKYLFEDIYDFAGDFRDVNIKKVWQWDYFIPYEEIDNKLDETLNRHKQQATNITSDRAYSSFLANFYKELICIHPFREGNGRTIREFLREFVDYNNKNINFGEYELDYSLIDKDNFNEGIKNNLIGTGLLEIEFYKGLVKTNEKKTKQ